MKLGPYELGYNDTNQGIYVGDARLLCEEIPDESIDLIFTDPVYQNMDDYAWLAEMATRVLKPTGAMLAFFGIGYIQDTLQALANGGMPHRWTCAVFVPGAGSRIAQRVFGNWQALAWCGGDPLHHMTDAVISRTATLRGRLHPHRLQNALPPLPRLRDNPPNRHASPTTPHIHPHTPAKHHPHPT